MQRSVALHLGVSGTFLGRRWEQPENWMRITAELGFPCHEFCADLLDPFFYGDHELQISQAQATREAADRYGVFIIGVYTGLATRRFHGLAHSDALVRQRMIEWIVGCMDIARAMGADRVGGHWGVIPVEVIEEGEHAYNQAVRRQHETYRELAQIARDKGLRAIYREPMHVPSEPPWTIKQAEEFLIEVNRSRDGCSTYLALNVGHTAGHCYGLTGRELDYREWLRALGAFAEVIHLQQTTADASHHWPFTAEYNRRGHIRPEAVLEALHFSHAHCHESWVSEILEPVGEQWLVVEVMPGVTRTERKLLEELAATAEYLKQYLPGGHLTLTV